MVADGLTFLHLSDIHFNKGTDGVYDSPDADLRNEIELDIQLQKKQLGGRIDYILVTGDIAFSGKRAEFDHAQRWLQKLCGICGCQGDAVFVTPGNHDAERAEVDKSKSLRDIRELLRRRSDEAAAARELDESLQDTDQGPSLLRPLTEYLLFAEKYGCAISPARPFWDADLVLNDGSILRLRGLNSVLLSDRHDDPRQHKLLLGAASLVLRRDPGVAYLTMCHHPPEWLLDADSVRDQLGRRARIQLYGHRHRQRIRREDDCLVITAGAVHPERGQRDWEPRYNLLRLAVEEKDGARQLHVQVLQRRFSAQQQRFVSDHDGTDSEDHVLPLPPWTKPRSEAKMEENAVMATNSEPAAASNPLVAGARPAMTPLRRLTYRFLSLSYVQRLRLAQDLQLVAEEDEGLSDVERFRQVLLRAKERGKLAELWNEVSRLHGEPAAPNPFEI